jgi:predicted amidophosphoribosyltransferase
MTLFFPCKCLTCAENALEGQVFCNRCKSGFEVLCYPRSCYDSQSETIVSHLYSEPISTLIKRAKGQALGLWDERLRRHFQKWIEHWIPVLETLSFDIIVSVPGQPLRSELETDLAAHTALEISRLTKKPVANHTLLRRRICDRDIFLLNKNPSVYERVLWRPFRFELEPQVPRLTSKRVLLVDDVMSSGATLKRCRKLLADCGNPVTATFVFAASAPRHQSNFSF